MLYKLAVILGLAVTFTLFAASSTTSADDEVAFP